MGRSHSSTHHILTSFWWCSARNIPGILFLVFASCHVCVCVSSHFILYLLFWLLLALRIFNTTIWHIAINEFKIRMNSDFMIFLEIHDITKKKCFFSFGYCCPPWVPWFRCCIVCILIFLCRLFFSFDSHLQIDLLGHHANDEHGAVVHFGYSIYFNSPESKMFHVKNSVKLNNKLIKIMLLLLLLLTCWLDKRFHWMYFRVSGVWNLYLCACPFYSLQTCCSSFIICFGLILSIIFFATFEIILFLTMHLY